jgi:arylsulfatase A-like enzyme
MIAWGPPIPPGTVNETPSAFWDLLPTFAEMLRTEISILHDGTSLWPCLTDPAIKINHPFLYWEHYITWEKKFTQAIRQGEWKALRIGFSEEPVKLELYNLTMDIAEENDLSGQFPKKMNEMIHLMESASERPENDTFVFYKDFLNE